MAFLKWFGWGILWVFLLPFVLLGVALVAVIGIPIFIAELIVMIVHFFRGEKCFPMFPEDVKAMEILQKSLDAQRGAAAPAQPQQPSNVYVQQNFYPYPQGQAGPMNPGLPPVPPQYGMPPLPPGQVPPGQLPPVQEPPQIATNSNPAPTIASFPTVDITEENAK